VGAGGFLAIIVYCYFVIVMVFSVGNIGIYGVGYCGVVVGGFSVCGCYRSSIYFYYLFFRFCLMFICLSIVFCICLSVLFILSGGAYLDSSAYYFWASRAFSNWTYLARISSALSIN
jgi:hypothetical protein